MVAVMNASASIESYVSLGGRRLALGSVWDSERFDARARRRLRNEFLAGAPFQHVIIDGLFDERLLDLVHDDFQQSPRDAWLHENGDNESTRRMRPGAILPAASELYFNTLYSNRFTTFISEITGLEHLIPDPTLLGGGLHENKPGDWFGVHLDFARHSKTFLHNELALITYLNRGWTEAYGGALELWDAQQRVCAKAIVPVFGRTVILRQGRESHHGHTAPVATPDGRPRRSVVADYYRNQDALNLTGIDPAEHTSLFLSPRSSLMGRIKRWAHLVTPPVLMSWLLRLRGRAPWLTPPSDS